MAFINQLGKIMSDVGQGMAQQTKNIGGLARLNGSISEKKHRISQLYTSLGQAYYAQYKDDPSAVSMQEIAEIKRLESEIAQCRDEINHIKNIVKCPGCGAEMSSHSAFCSCCGARMPQEETCGQDSEENAPDGCCTDGDAAGEEYTEGQDRTDGYEAPMEGYPETPTDEYTQAPTKGYPETPTDEYTQAPTEGYPETPTDEYTQTPTEEYKEREANADGQAGNAAGEETTLTCPGCQAPVTPGNRFCSQCGARLERG